MIRQKQSARRGALFFCLTLVFAAILGLASVSCSRADIRADEPDASAAENAAPLDGGAIQVVSESSPSPRKHYSRRNLEEMESELDWERNQNRILKEENDWLRVRVMQLQQELVTANQNIYSLNRKLDAIFKPN